MNESILEQNRKAYDVLAESYTQQWVENPDLLLANEFLSRLEKGMRILDVGCGPGHYSSYFIDQGYFVEAIDISSAMLRLVRNRDSRIQSRILDMSNLDYRDHEFDGLWVCASLPHIPKESVGEVLTGFRRVLNYNGCMLVNAIIGHLDHRIETQEEMGSDFGEPGRFFQWYPSVTVFKTILEQAGFKVQAEQYRNVTSEVLKYATCRTNSWYNCFCV